MVTHGIPFSRLLSATESELTAFAGALGVELAKEEQCLGSRTSPELRAALLSKSFEDISKQDYHSLLTKVAAHLTAQVSWRGVGLQSTLHHECLENFIFHAHIALQLPPSQPGSTQERATLRELALKALNDEADRGAPTTGPPGDVGEPAVTPWFIANLAALRLWKPSMKKLVSATLLLIHVRKRVEHEQRLHPPEAA